MAAHADRIMDEAIAWHLGLEDAGAESWHRFVAWLEADPAHAQTYDRLTLGVAELALPVNGGTWVAPARQVSVWPRRIAWGGSAVAAVAAALLTLVPPAATGTALYSIETSAGSPREVTLADGSRITLNGATRITLDRNDPRVATLDRGEAVFDVVHHADRPFELHAAETVLRDVGTRFDVTRRANALEVAVAEGEVVYQPNREKVSLTRGMALVARDGDDRLAIRRVAPEVVGGWRRGVVDFRDVPLATVAEDLSRSAAAEIRVAAAMGGRSFTGTVRVDRAPGDIAGSLALLAGGAARRDGRIWVIEPTSASAR